MKKLILWTCLTSISSNLVACTPRDAQYYAVHPKALQEVVTSCPAKQPKLVSCETLNEIALRMNDYVYELRIGPQEYGKKILALEEQIISDTSNVPSDAKAFEKKKQELRERLAIVSWLESPVS